MSRKWPVRMPLTAIKFPELGRSPAERAILAVGSKRSHGGADASERQRAQSRFCGRIHHQARFVSILRVGRASDQLHALHRVGRKLGGKDLALLIADGLAIDHKADLSVIAQRMEKSVRVGGRTSRAVVDDAAQPGRGVECSAAS